MSKVLDDMPYVVRDAFREICGHEKHARPQPYWWRQASMLKLAELGLVEAYSPGGKDRKIKAYRLTQLGRDAAEPRP